MQIRAVSRLAEVMFWTNATISYGLQCEETVDLPM